MALVDEASTTIESIAQSVARGQCILFLGAGVHGGPPDGSPYKYPEADRPPLGSDLSQALAKKCGFSDRFPNASPTALQRVSLYYEIVTSRSRLVEEIREAVHTGRKPSPVLHALARLNFPLVITTNYDQLFEKALIAAGKDPLVKVYESVPRQATGSLAREDPTPDSPLVFKIHGDINHPDSIVITDEDYIQFILRMSHGDQHGPIPIGLRFRLMTWPTVFVGYSLLDYNLRLLFKTLRWEIDPSSIPEMYSVDASPDPLIFDVWHNQRRYVKFIAQDVWQFVPRLYQIVTGKDLPV